MLTSPVSATHHCPSALFLPGSMISALFVANFKGDTLISRLYRDDVTPRVSDAFRVHIVHSRTPIRSPINNINRTTYMHVKRNNLWIVAATRQVCG